ncbi:glycerol-3-phosphate 1-O-acyltransferase PlsY [Komagataeibacter sp. FNDCR2]|uniref:glycerol-3-phosphate 1-O-acyltransferase PlsY n=1 Tax=Komagataeibacter sp. FNDCR2 TaxID=2878682 RepID=UPI001E3302D4|nr:glycerol-3-phosphate 1-O-acyltransferase PlsY [Komagataeibacter sp. FNDCR2]MCE2575300.1 glycerol-3-phosphate 1-O-acyltransferase PlsY [Komagataeibacter sp. FNDCR2]
MIYGIPTYDLPLMGGVAFLSYLIGSVPFGLVLTALSGNGDIRKIGSGNIGATNVLRTGRKGLAAGTLALDGTKGAFAVFCAFVLCPFHTLAAESLAALCVVLGHCFPVWLKFRGGKGVATGLGSLLALMPVVGLCCCALWLIFAKVTRISSAGAILAFAMLPLLMIRPGGVAFSSPAYLAGALIAAVIVLRHHANISRLLRGTEPRIGRKNA